MNDFKLISDPDWIFRGPEEPESAPDGSVWRDGTKRYLRINGKWIMSGSYEARAEWEKTLEKMTEQEKHEYYQFTRRLENND